MRFAALLLCVLLAWSFGDFARAEEISAGSVLRISTRGATLPIFTVWKKDAVATLVLYSGGGGGYGKLGEDGWPGSPNFLIRSAKLFAAQPFNVVLVGRASDVANLDGVARSGDSHDVDNQAIFRAILAQSRVPLWLVGTSMGTISATAAAIRDEGRSVAGIVLTSSVTAYRVPGAVPRQELGKIGVPVLVVHHVRDACKVCTPHEAKNIADALKNAPIKKTLLLDGGGEPTGDPCEPMHYHGFIGMEQQAVDLISAWIQHPTP
jgi:pimeloyl-ACP methyl ester carboxylesterase